MNRRQLSAYLDALSAGRRPGKARPDAEDVDVIRAAIELRAARPGDAAPDQQFVSDLYHELADQTSSSVVPIDRPVRARRARVALVSIAAGVVLVGGTVVATEAIDQPAVAPAAARAPQGSEVRTATFETADSRVMGQIVAYSGNPSWVYMNVDVPNYDGKIICMLQGRGGSTVAAGVFELHSGMGAWSKTVRVDIDQLRGAKLVTSSGATVAAATFA
ncbi:MAG: hypothetical protein ABSC41_06820 [Acidimicrobiales bacterium]